jgi:hypothetical protein
MVKKERTWKLITFITFALQLQEGTFLVAFVYLNMGEETKISNTTTTAHRREKKSSGGNDRPPRAQPNQCVHRDLWKLTRRFLRSNSQRCSCCRMLPMTETPGHSPSCRPMHLTPGAASMT